MYVLTNIEANVTHKVLKGIGPQAGHDLPEPERKTLRDLIAKLTTAIDNGLPEEPGTPPVVDNAPPVPPPVVDAKPPETPDKPPVVDTKPPEGKPEKPGHDLPDSEAKPKK